MITRIILLNKVLMLYVALVFVLTLASCKKESVIPGNGQDAYLNFYTASDALLQGNLTDQNMIFINDSVPNPRYKQFPLFSAAADDFRQYPRTPTVSNGTGDEIAIPPGTSYQVVYWMPVIADEYNFIFTSANKVFLKDSKVTLNPKSFTIQYLTESPEADNAYTIVAAPVERKGVPGKVRIQIVHLSTDFGNMDVYHFDDKGNIINENLPLNLGFGKFSTYAEIDTIGSSKTHDQIILQIRQSGKDSPQLIAAIPAIPESSFTIVVQGFMKETIRRVKTSETQQQTVKIRPNLRYNIRRIF